MNKGYAEMSYPFHPRSRKNGFIYVHIISAEWRIGRYLQPGEVVHHLDKDKLNNSQENLIVFKTGGDHIRFHAGYPLVATEEPYVFTCPTNVSIFKEKAKQHNTKRKIKNKCKDCGVIIDDRSKRCSVCANKDSALKRVNIKE